MEYRPEVSSNGFCLNAMKRLVASIRTGSTRELSSGASCLTIRVGPVGLASAGFFFASEAMLGSSSIDTTSHSVVYPELAQDLLQPFGPEVTFES